jgi:tRNA nucleotidyltransferase (CCA-adding enzyme)
MPELAALSGIPQRADYHPEVDTLVHTRMCIDAAARMGFPAEVRVAALLHDLGKACTPRDELPGHRGHDARGLPLVEGFCARLRVPNASRDLALAVTRDHLLVHRARELRPGTLLDLLERFGAFRKASFFEQALDSCLCDARGRLGFEQTEYPQVDYLRQARVAAEAVPVADVIAAGFAGAAVGEELRRRREQALARWKQAQPMHG